MSKPLLQVALDHLDIPSALAATRSLVDEVDVLEMGTILCYAEGAKTVGMLRALYPEKMIVADLKAADAGGTVAETVEQDASEAIGFYDNAALLEAGVAIKIAEKPFRVGEHDYPRSTLLVSREENPDDVARTLDERDPSGRLMRPARDGEEGIWSVGREGYDDDGDGLGEVDAELVSLDLTDGSVVLSLNPLVRSVGEIEEHTPI